MVTREKDQERFYLFPGMGGAAYRRKRNRIIQAALIVGLIVSAVFAVVMYFTHLSPK